MNGESKNFTGVHNEVLNQKASNKSPWFKSLVWEVRFLSRFSKTSKQTFALLADITILNSLSITPENRSKSVKHRFNSE